MDISSEMIHALLPVYPRDACSARHWRVGLLEGTAEAIASITKVFSGVLSDRLGNRKRSSFGYGLAALTKPMFALAPSVGWVFAARLADRVGKGIRGAPRDALIADITPPHLRGAASACARRSTRSARSRDRLLAIALMAATAARFTAVFWIAVIPALASLV